MRAVKSSSMKSPANGVEETSDAQAKIGGVHRRFSSLDVAVLEDGAQDVGEGAASADDLLFQFDE